MAEVLFPKSNKDVKNQSILALLQRNESIVRDQGLVETCLSARNALCVIPIMKQLHAFDRKKTVKVV